MLHRIQLRTSILGLFLALLASTMGYAQVPAGPHRPAGVPDGYVITPFGYFHPSCVRQLAEGETLLADGRVMQHANGTLETVPACGYPRFTPTGEIVIAGAAGVPPPAINGWIESASVTTSTSYGALTATWTVPPTPASNDGQTLFFFPGMEDINHVVSIIQPVLGWNSDFRSAWGIASWNCCPSGITWESSPVSVKPGHKIKGIIKNACSAGTLSCAKWNVTTQDVSTGHSTKLSNTPSEGQTFNWAFAGAVEVYGVVQCNDFPSNGSITYSQEALYDYKFAQVSNPNWSISLGSGFTPQCGYGGTVAPTQVTLNY